MGDEDLTNHDEILVTLSVLIVIIRGIIQLIVPIMLCFVECQEVTLGPQQYQGLRYLSQGIHVGDILLDTGCSRILVRRDLVNLLTGEAVAIRCAHGDTVLYPLAQVQLEVEQQVVNTIAAVADRLPMSVLLGELQKTQL